MNPALLGGSIQKCLYVSNKVCTLPWTFPSLSILPPLISFSKFQSCLAILPLPVTVFHLQNWCVKQGHRRWGLKHVSVLKTYQTMNMSQYRELCHQAHHIFLSPFEKQEGFSPRQIVSFEKRQHPQHMVPVKLDCSIQKNPNRPIFITLHKTTPNG